MGKGQAVGYIRVSSAGQNDERQLAGVELDEVFREKISAVTTDRPKLTECITYLRKNDSLHVHSMDRLARNLVDLQKILQCLVDKGVEVRFHKENLVFKGDSSPFDKLLLQVIGAFSEFERSILKERQREGIENARRNGKHLGRLPTLADPQIAELRELAMQGEKKTALAARFNISRTTVYAYLRQ